MGLPDEPDNEIYRLTKNGTFALLKDVDAADTAGASAKASKAQACEAVSAYLDAAFLGSFLRGSKDIPFAENAGVLGTYIDFLDHEVERGATHATRIHQVHLKPLAYVTAIEAAVPLALFGNCLEFLSGKRVPFDFGIYDSPSAYTRLQQVGGALARAGSAPTQFVALYSGLEKLIDRTLRNAIAHAAYRVEPDTGTVDVWAKGKYLKSFTFVQIDEFYRDARCYLQGFMRGVRDFAYQIHDECPYVWHP